MTPVEAYDRGLQARALREARRCTATHPRLSPGRTCDEPLGHDGHHVANDGCGRPEYFWAQR